MLKVDPTPTVEFEVNSSAMQIDQLTRDRQAKSSSALLARSAVVNLMELFKYLLSIFGRYPGAGVANRDVELAIVSMDADTDRSGVGEFYRVADEIYQVPGSAGAGRRGRSAGAPVCWC